MTTPTYEQIKPYIEKKLVSVNFHPEDSRIAIFNYTQSCQFASAWDDITRQCRGLIMNVETGEVLARPFPKFFNYGEHVNKGWPIPSGVPIVSEKLDGSLGILYALEDRIPRIATRGSFTSDQAVWATKWWHDHVAMLPSKGETHLFEIIYPENRIVVSYDYSGLVHLVTLDNETGRPKAAGLSAGLRTARMHATRTLEELAADNEHPNEEGFVLFYPEENVRMKIKFPEYVRLHKLITGVSKIAIWEHLRDGNGLADLLEKVPDEFFKWVEETQDEIQGKYDGIETRCQEEFRRAMEDVGEEGAPRKAFADAIQARMVYPGIGFAMLDGKDYAPIIWKMVRPSGASAFKTDIDL